MVKNKKVILRNPLSTRPWQHVLEAIGGYLIFGAKLRSNSKIKGEVFNFGPNYNYSHSVIDLVREMKKVGIKSPGYLIKRRI